jgi:hypothetical protein
MLRSIGRLLLSLSMVLQTIKPALACPCQNVEVVAVEPACGCEVETSVETGCGCEAAEVIADSCETCGEEVVSCDECGTEAQADEEKSAEPQPAETKKTETEETAVTPQPVLPPSTNETTSEDLGPAPINVPNAPAVGTATEPATAPTTTTNEVFPGPAATDPVTPPTSTPADTTPTTEPTPPSRINTEGLFDEPAAKPADSTPTEDTESTTTTTEELFVEPSQPAPSDSNESTEEATTESAETESEETAEETPASNPLDELFSPSTPAAEPAPEAAPADETETDTEAESTEGEETEKPASDPFDPFSQNELPVELRLPGGLASQDFRGWSDRANNFQVNARLVRMSAEGVFLADEAGEYVAMSFSQLSDADLSFIREQVRAQRVVLAQRQATFVARAAK